MDNIPRWACSSVSVSAASPLQHVNRYYWIYMRHINCLLANTNGIWRRDHANAIRRILEAEKRYTTIEYNEWRLANGHGPLPQKDPGS